MHRDRQEDGLAPERSASQVSRRPVDITRLIEIGRDLLHAIGEEPEREGLLRTPERWARWWQEFIDYDPGNTDVTFEAIRTDQMIVVTGIRVWSLCEHHLLPFWVDVSVGYICEDTVLGLSKIARIAHDHAHRLQIQERLADGIARSVRDLANTPSVAVLCEGVHLCMVMRGVKTQGTMKTSVMYGAFRQDINARQEFLSMCERGHT
jgi:GTP cyclohydrolase I